MKVGVCFLIGVLSFGLRLKAAEPEGMERLFQSLGSPGFEIGAEVHDLTNPTDPWLMRFFRQDLFKYVPTGEPSVDRPDCRFASRALAEKNNFPAFKRELLNYLKECHDEFQDGPRDFLRNLYLSMMVSLQIREHPYVRHVMFDLPGGVRLKGFLALHDDKPRPLVLLRLGIFSNAEEFFPERFLFMQLFEQSPFNMLVLESMTGVEFVRRNQARGFAGLDESVQNLHILRRLRNPKEPLAKLVTSLHLAGFSMGGHGQLLTHLMQSRQGEKPWVNSTLLFCPLINLKSTFEAHRNLKHVATFMNYWVRSKYPFLAEQDPEAASEDFMGFLLRGITSRYQGPLSDEAWIQWPKGLREARHDFWKGNDFWGEFRDVPTPLLLFTTRQDDIVPYALNAGLLESGSLNLGRSPWLMIPLEYGYHCSFPGPYDWTEMATITRDYILNFSPEFHFKEDGLNFPMTAELRTFFAANGFHPRWKVALKTGQSEALMQVKFYASANPSWWQRLNPLKAEFRLPLKEFDFYRDQPLRSKVEIDLYTRWIFQNVSLARDGDQLRFSWRRAE